MTIICKLLSLITRTESRQIKIVIRNYKNKINLTGLSFSDKKCGNLVNEQIMFHAVSEKDTRRKKEISRPHLNTCTLRKIFIRDAIREIILECASHAF